MREKGEREGWKETDSPGNIMPRRSVSGAV